MRIEEVFKRFFALLSKKRNTIIKEQHDYSIRTVHVSFFDVPHSVFLVIKKKGWRTFFCKLVNFIGLFAKDKFQSIVGNVHYLFRASREWSDKMKFLLFHPLSFIEKYLRKMGKLQRVWRESIRMEGLKISTLRSINYVLYGKGVLHSSDLKFRRQSGFERMGRFAENMEKTISCIDEFIGLGKLSKEVVLLVSHDASATGAPILLMNIAKTLHEEMNKEVVILLIQGGVLEKDFGQYGCVINLNQLSNKHIEEPLSFDKLCNRLRYYGVKKCMVNTVVSGVVVPTLEANGFECTTLIHELPGLIERHGYAESFEGILKSNSKIVLPTQYSKDSYRKKFAVNDSKIIVRPQGLYTINPRCDQREESRIMLREKLGLKKTDKIILGCGYAEYRKGVDLFFDVAKLVFEDETRRDDIYFVWIGEWEPGMLRKVENLAKGKAYRNCIKLLGFQKDLSFYYAGADAFLLTSREDPFPSVVLDSMNCGVPVIAFDGAGGAPEALSDGCGVVVPFVDTVAMTREVFKLLSNKNRYDAISVQSKERIRSPQYEFKNYVEQLLKLFSNKSFCNDSNPNEKNNLTVSVIVPNYNYEGYLEERLQSIINQTVKPMEIIFLDDNSTDKSVLLAEKILATSNIPYTVTKNDSNKGCFSQWAKGIKMAKGDLVWIAEADDSCDTEFLEVLIDAFLDPEVGLAYSQSVRMNADGVKDDTYLPYLESIPGADTHWRNDYVNSGRDEVCKYLSIKNTIVNASAVLMRRELLLQVGDEIGGGFSQAGDWFTYVKLLRNSKIAFSASILNYHRYHKNNIVSRSGVDSFDRAKQLISETLSIQNFIIESFPVSQENAALGLAHAELIANNFLGGSLDSFSEYKDILEYRKGLVRSIPKRICFFSTNDGWGGSEVACVKLAQGFSDAGWIVSLVMNSCSPRPSILEKIIDEDTISLFERTPQDYCQSFEVASFVLDFDPEIMFISQGHAFEAVKLMAWCQENKIPYTNYIPLVTEYHLSIMKPSNENIEENAVFLSQSKKIFSDNAHAKEILQKIFDTQFENFEVIRNGFDVDYHQQFVWSKPKEGIFRVAFFGRLEKVHKGLDLLMKVLLMRKWRERKLEILMYGHGSYELEIKKIIKKNNLKNIALCGYSENIQSAILNAHGVIFPSRMEGTPIALVDALLCFRMAIVTPVGGMMEVVSDGQSGFVASAPTVDGIDACMEKAWKRRSEWEEIGKNAGVMIRKIVSEFPQKECIDSLNKLLD